MINFVRLRHVVAVDREGSFSRAAEALNVTQSAITKNVAGVEDEVGHPLFERNARGATATPEGRDFIDRASRIITEIDLLVADVRKQRRGERRLLRIGVCPPAIAPFLSKALAELVKDFPDLSLHLSALTSERALRFLKRGDFDVVVGPTEIFEYDTQLERADIGVLKAFMFVRNGHPLAVMKNVYEQDLKQFRILAPEHFISYSGVYDRLYVDTEHSPAEMISVIDHFPLVTSIVRNSDRIGVVGGGYHRSERFKRHFTTLDIDLFEPMSVSCATLRVQQSKPIVDNLITLLAATWGESPI
ncbi:LysR family transcriptional regulator [Sphingopyxis sp.]|uniref:LysR family transcriptional regulator n=1 Tax=Sphingopyxis sp. TaxID=1908224 RepID=UPI0025D22B6A|nr:LysR family transcriptional regulator [Sphingopyxis sp.]MBK6411612.1 LysR family transcriptional regulator [Sphingopyxis sp.]